MVSMANENALTKDLTRRMTKDFNRKGHFLHKLVQNFKLNNNIQQIL